jgi:hypothetical protein
MRRKPLLVAFLVSLITSSACSKALTRDRAADAIKKDRVWDEAEYSRADVGSKCTSVTKDDNLRFYENAMGKGKEPPPSRNEDLFTVTVSREFTEEVDRLAQADDGVSLDKIPRSCTSYFEWAGSKYGREQMAHSRWFVSETTVKKEAIAAGVPAQGGRFEIRVYKFGEVTGITENPNGTALAEFVWTLEPNDVVKKLAPDWKPDTRTGRAEFRRFDDGWRAERVVLAGI